MTPEEKKTSAKRGAGFKSIRLLFANTGSADPDHDQTMRRFVGQAHYGKGPWLWILLEQVINSVIVGGIVFLSTLGPGNALEWIPAAKGFGLTFLFELRKYRQLANPNA